MTAPSVVHISSSQLGGDASLPNIAGNLTTAAVGDLAVIISEGLQTSGSLLGPEYSADLSTAGYTSSGPYAAVTASGNGRIMAYWKRLVSADFSGSNFRVLLVSANTFTGHRAQLYIFRHARGFDSTIFAATGNNTNQANDTAITLTDFTREGVVVVGSATTTNATTQTVAWDAGTARDPYCDDSGTTTTSGGHSSHFGSNLGNDQSDYNEYDAGTTATSYAMHVQCNTNTHSFVALQFRVAPASTVTGTALVSGGGTVRATPTVVTVGATAAVTGGGTTRATPTVVTKSGTAVVSGGGTVHGEQQGTVTVTGTARVTGTMSTTARQAVNGIAVVSGGGTTTGSGTRTLTGTGRIAIVGTTTAAQQTTTTIIPAGGTWSLGAGLVRGGDTITGTARVAITAAVSAAGHKLANGQGNGATRPAVFITASGTVTVTGTANVEILSTIDTIGFEALPRIPAQVSRNSYATVEVF